MKQVNAVKVEKDREFSVGALTQKWYGNLMPFKMTLEANQPKKALALLPKPATLDKRNMDPYSVILLAYKLHAEALQFTEKGEKTKARKRVGKLALLLSDMQKMRTQVSQSYEFRDFLRSLEALLVLHKELTAVTSDNDGLASLWYVSVIDAEMPAARLLPPEILYPMDY